jgi:hypothetical protein
MFNAMQSQRDAMRGKERELSQLLQASCD